MKVYKFGIIGCSRIAESHIEAIKESPGMELAAVSDIAGEKACDYGTRHGCSHYSDHRDMLARPDLDIISVCTPSGLHAILARDAALSGRHVVVEKPLSLTLEDADALIATCRSRGVKLGVVHQLRFTPVVQQLKRAVAAGQLGKLTHGSVILRWNRSDAYFGEAAWRGTMAMDGGALFNQALHYIDILIWLLGPVKSVFGYAATQLRHIETEDVSVAVLRFANGALGNLEIAITVYPKNLEESLSIFSEKATVVLNGKYAHNIVSLTSFEDLGLERGYDPPRWRGHQMVFQDMVEAIETGREPLTNGEEARRVLEVISAIYKSSAEGKQVVMG